MFEDVADKGRFVEVFKVASWLEHLRQHQRITNADRIIQDSVHRFHAASKPTVSHLLAAQFPGYSVLDSSAK